MKALTICQPYAHLIAWGEKRVENRSWPTNYRGPLAIHAGKSRSWINTYTGPVIGSLDFGAVVAIARLTACVPFHLAMEMPKDSALHWMTTHRHVEGPYCWVLEDVKRLAEPVYCDGHQGFWEADVPEHAALIEV